MVCGDHKIEQSPKGIFTSVATFVKVSSVFLTHRFSSQTQRGAVVSDNFLLGRSSETVVLFGIPITANMASF